MSCYMRHLGNVLAAAGIADTRENRRQAHALLQDLTREQDCPRVWSRLKALLAEEGGAPSLAGALRERWPRRPGG